MKTTFPVLIPTDLCNLVPTPKHFSFAFPATSPPHATLLLLIYIYGLPSWSYSTTVALIEANWTSEGPVTCLSLSSSEADDRLIHLQLSGPEVNRKLQTGLENWARPIGSQQDEGSLLIG